MTCLIISGGEFFSVSKDEIKADFVVACDTGYDYAKKIGIVPNVVIGDFDSVENEIDENIEQIKFSSEKDDTDTLCAVKYAIKNGASEIKIIFAFGGRFDHSFSNIQTGVFAVKNGIKVSLLGKNEKAYIIRNSSIEIKREKNCYLSVFSLSDESRGVSESGTKYTLKDAKLTNDFPLGISNEWKSNKAIISVKNGILMILVEKIVL